MLVVKNTCKDFWRSGADNGCGLTECGISVEMNIYARCLFRVIACLFLAVAFTHSYSALALSGGSLSPPALQFNQPSEPEASDQTAPALKNSFTAQGAVESLFPDFTLQAPENPPFPELKFNLNEQYPGLVYAALAGAAALLAGLVVAVLLLVHLRRAMRKLKLAEQRYRAMFENAAEGIFHLAPGSKLAAANAALAEMLGYSGAQAVLNAGLVVRDVLVNPAVEAELLSRLKAFGVVPGTDVSVRRSDGQERILWVTLLAVHDVRGNIEFIEGRAMDDERRVHHLKLVVITMFTLQGVALALERGSGGQLPPRGGHAVVARHAPVFAVGKACRDLLAGHAFKVRVPAQQGIGVHVSGD